MIDPLKTSSSFVFPTGTDSPVMAASLIVASPVKIFHRLEFFRPSERRLSLLLQLHLPIRIPNLHFEKQKLHPMPIPSILFNDALVLLSVRASRYAPNKNRNVTAADSTYSPINNAAVTAMVTNNSMLKAFIRNAWNALMAIGTPATIVATINAPCLIATISIPMSDESNNQ